MNGKECAKWGCAQDWGWVNVIDMQVIRVCMWPALPCITSNEGNYFNYYESSDNQVIAIRCSDALSMYERYV